MVGSALPRKSPSVSVTDDDGGQAQKTFHVTVNNVAPRLTVVGDQTVNEGSALSLIDLGTFTDPGFNNVGLGTTESFSFFIDWGDTTANGGPATVDVAGHTGVVTQGSFDGVHTYADNGLYTVTVTVSDDDGGQAQKTFHVAVNNLTPSGEHR